MLVAAACEQTRRSGLEGRIGGFALCSWDALERETGLADGFDHVVALDPPHSRELDELFRASAGIWTAHLAWGDPEVKFSLDVLDDQQRLRADLAVFYRSLRAAAAGPLRELGGVRSPARAGRLLRVLHELGLAQVDATSHDVALGEQRERVDLERSAAYRALLELSEERRRWLTRSIALAA